jgi:hypothetical protein
MSKKVIAVIIALLLVTFISLLLLTSSQNHSSRVQRLPDGSLLKLVSVSYGPTHSYSMPVPNRWQSFLLKHLPASWTSRLGLSDMSAGVVSSARPGESNWGFITIRQHGTPTHPSFPVEVFAPRLEVFDELGRSYGTAQSGSSADGSDSVHRRYWELDCWMLNSKVPIDSKKLVLRFSEYAPNGKAGRQLAEFIIPNPGENNASQSNPGAGAKSK